MIGEGDPTFSIKVNKVPSVVDMLTSTSITLGEAYMNGDIEIEGDLYKALNMFLGQMGKFSTDQNKLKKLIFTSLSKKNQQKEVSSHYDIGNDFYSLWLDETMSYSCGYFKTKSSTSCSVIGVALIYSFTLSSTVFICHSFISFSLFSLNIL